MASTGLPAGNGTAPHENDKDLQLEEGEGEGLVSHKPVNTATSSGRVSAKWQLIFVFLGTALFMLLVGFVIGRDTAVNTGTTGGVPKKPAAGGEDKDGEITKLPQHTDDELAPFIPANLKAAKEMALKSLDTLEKYWAPHTEAVLTGDNGLVFGFSGKKKAPSNPESFQRTVDLIARVLVHTETLKLGFIGSSVMCGHDNCYYDSFPSQLQRFIGPIFTQATGKNIEIRNACQGGTCGDSYQNQIFCFRHMVGDDIDFLFYEWTYFENGAAFMYHETVTRWATLLPKSPATIVINCDGNAWGNDNVPKKYAKWGVNGINLESGLKAGPYKGKVWGAVGDGVHNTTRYGEGEDVSAKRRDSLGVVFRNWHPGPLGLQYVSDLTSYLFLRAMVKAIDDILAEPHKAASKWPKEPMTSVGDLPDLSFSRRDNEELYRVATLEEDPPGCYTIQKSTFGRPQVVIADNVADMLNPYKEKVKKLGSGEDAWSVWNAAPNWQMVPRDERSMGDMCRPPDNCAYFVEPASRAGTPLVFRLPKMTTGLIALCGGDGNAGKDTLITPGAFVAEFDGKVLDPKNYVIFPHTKCLALQTKFSGPVEDKHGHLYLAIYSKATLHISQVITA